MSAYQDQQLSTSVEVITELLQLVKL